MGARDKTGNKDLLDAAANAIKSGRFTEGKSRLLEVLRREPENVLALLWLTKCVDDPAKKVELFKRVLALDPHNTHAAKGIAAYSEPSSPIPPSREPQRDYETAPGKEAATSPTSEPATKQCPYCAEIIKEQAKVCRYCRRDLALQSDDASDKPADGHKKKRRSLVPFLLLGIFGVCSCIFVIGALSDSTASSSSSSDRDTRASPSKAFTICKDIVEAQLVAPSTAEFASMWESRVMTLGRESGEYEDAYRVMSHVDSQNGFGAMIRTDYTCDVSFEGGEWTDLSNWRLLRLDTYP